jgi:hypothetical protein
MGMDFCFGEPDRQSSQCAALAARELNASGALHGGGSASQATEVVADRNA